MVDQTGPNLWDRNLPGRDDTMLVPTAVQWEGGWTCGPGGQRAW